MRKKAIQNILFAILFLGSFIFATWAALHHFEDSPRVWFDDGLYMHVADTLAQKGVYGIELAPSQFSEMSYITVGFPVLYPLAFIFKITSSSIFIARIFSIFWIFALLYAAFFFVWKRAGRWPALLALMLLATFSPLFGNGKNVLGEVPGIFFLVFSLFALERARASERYFPFLAAGVLAGLSAATKPTFLPFLVLFAITMLILRLQKKISTRSFVIWAISACIPVGVWFLTQFGSTLNIAGIFAHYANPYNDPNQLSHLGQNLKRFFTESTPIHCLLLFVFSAAAITRMRKKITAAEWILFLFSAFILVNFIKSPGWYRYFFPAHLLLLILVPSLISHFKYRRRLYVSLLTGFLLLALFDGFYTYRNIDRMYYPPWRQVEGIVLNEKQPILFFNVPDAAFFSKQKKFYQVVSIRPGLSYGDQNFEHLDRIGMIVTRDAPLDLERIKLTAPGFRESAHIGNYYIFQKYKQ